MTPSWMMDADCIHGVVWYECEECAKEERERSRKAHPSADNPNPS